MNTQFFEKLVFGGLEAAIKRIIKLRAFLKRKNWKGFLGCLQEVVEFGMGSKSNQPFSNMQQFASFFLKKMPSALNGDNLPAGARNYLQKRNPSATKQEGPRHKTLSM